MTNAAEVLEDLKHQKEQESLINQLRALRVNFTKLKYDIDHIGKAIDKLESKLYNKA